MIKDPDVVKKHLSDIKKVSSPVLAAVPVCEMPERLQKQRSRFALEDAIEIDTVYPNYYLSQKATCDKTPWFFERHLLHETSPLYMQGSVIVIQGRAIGFVKTEDSTLMLGLHSVSNGITYPIVQGCVYDVPNWLRDTAKLECEKIKMSDGYRSFLELDRLCVRPSQKLYRRGVFDGLVVY